MVRYEVVRRDGHGRQRGRVVAPGLEPVDVLHLAEARFRPLPEPVTYEVYRVRRFRKPKHMVTYAGGSGDGLAGVREPRRPLPNPPGLRAEAPLRD